MEELKEQWHKDAHKALENDVFLSKYAEDRDIKVTEKELEKEIEHIKEHSKQKADESTYKDPQWRSYIRRVLLKRKSYQNFLSEIGGSKGKKSKKKAEAKKSQETDK
jgi:FKBP-type peptidyl-prolyl cis-trans isomerase (trigger factor)